MTPATLAPLIDPIPEYDRLRNVTHICVSGAATPEGTTNSIWQIAFDWGCVISNTTNSGMLFIENPFRSSSDEVMELHRLTGFTWDQLAKLFGVSRRALHFWASGKALNAANEEHLSQMLAVMRNIDRGSAQGNRSILLTKLPDGTRPFEMLMAKDYEGVKEKVRTEFSGLSRKTAKPTRHVTALNTPPPPKELVGALQDSIHVQRGRLISTTPLKRKGKS